MNHSLHVPQLLGRLSPLIMALGRLGQGRRSPALLDGPGGFEGAALIEVDPYGDLESMSLFRADPHDDLTSLSLSRADTCSSDRHHDLVDWSLSRPEPAWLRNGWSRLV